MGVVCNDTESGVGGVFLHDPPQCHLSGRSHSICFIKDDKLEVGDVILIAALVEAASEDLLGRRECLDLLSDHVDTSVVGCVQLQDHLSHVFVAIDLSCQGEYCGCFAGTGRAV